MGSRGRPTGGQGTARITPFPHAIASIDDDARSASTTACATDHSMVAGTHHYIQPWDGVGGKGPSFKAHLLQPPCHVQGHLQPDEAAHSPIQPGLEKFQGWGISHCYGQPVPWFCHPRQKKKIIFFLTSSLHLPS